MGAISRRVEGVAEGCEGFETFVCEAIAFLVVVGAEFGDDAADRHWICQKFRYLTQRPLVVDGFVFARVEIGVPV